MEVLKPNQTKFSVFNCQYSVSFGIPNADIDTDCKGAESQNSAPLLLLQPQFDDTPDSMLCHTLSRCHRPSSSSRRKKKPPPSNSINSNSSPNASTTHFSSFSICSQPASVAQWAESQCAPTGTACRRSRSSIPGRPVDFVFGFQGRML